VNCGDAAASAPSQECSPGPGSPPITSSGTPSAPPSASRTRGALAADVITAFASPWRSRNASASGPNNDESGSAIAAMRNSAVNATPVSTEAALTIPTTSPRPMPSSPSAFASRFAWSASWPKV